MRLVRLLPPRLAGGRFVSAIGRRVFPRADTALERATHGRFSLTRAIGMRLMVLETTGRRSGRPRTTPLIFATQGAADSPSPDFLVAGSNWGRERQPGWVLNLLADAHAVVSLDRERIPVRARRLTGQERVQAWRRLLELWPAYDGYARRVRATSGREIMVFRLERT